MEIKSLNYFGLSSNLAKVFISISGTRFLTAKEIQKRAGVPRQEIYAILTSLEELGLVEKTVGRPIRFKGVPIKQGLAFLIKKKKDEAKKCKKLQKK
ncbi:helix-turn-helix domain-containing protein [Thermoproteota archaeon]